MKEKCSPKSCLKRLFDSAWTRIFIIFASLAFLLRVVFFVWQRADIEINFFTLSKAFGIGFFYDILTLAYIALIPLAYYAFVPTRILNSTKQQKANKVFYFLFLVVIIFSAVSEIVFWDEFQMRFNFIAVDYLIYTTEVVGNIVESYPIIPIFGGIFAFTLVIFHFTKNKILITKAGSFKCRIKKFLVLASFCLIAFWTVDNGKITHFFSNKYVSEISRNGIYQLFSAYRNNEIDYDSLYITRDEKEVIGNLRASLQKQEPSVKFLNEDDIARITFNGSIQSTCVANTKNRCSYGDAQFVINLVCSSFCDDTHVRRGIVV